MTRARVWRGKVPTALIEMPGRDIDFRGCLICQATSRYSMRDIFCFLFEWTNNLV